MQNKKCGPDSRGRISCLIQVPFFLSSFAFSGRMVQPFCLQTSTLPRIWVEPQNVLIADLGWNFLIIIASLLSLVAWKRKKRHCKQKGKTVPEKYTALIPMVQHSYTRSIPLLLPGKLLSCDLNSRLFAILIVSASLITFASLQLALAIDMQTRYGWQGMMNS